MKTVLFRLLTGLLCMTLLLGAVACAPSAGNDETTAETTNGTHADSGVTDEETTPSVDTALDTEGDTADETLPPSSDYEVTVNGSTADVLTPAGLSYTVSGYDSLDKATATFREGLTYTFTEDTFSERYNRMTVTYTSTEPLKLWVTYTARGKEVEDYYYLEAGKTTFSGLSNGFLLGYSARKITSLRVETCTGKSGAFTLVNLTTELMEMPEKTYYLENQRFKLGVELAWGGTISYLSDKNCPVSGLANLVNQHDTGRLIQQSFYGVQENEEYTPGISFDSKWWYNPVQGGDQYNNASRLIDLVITENSIYIKAQPQDWSLNNQLTPSYMENTYTLEDDVVRVDNRFTDFSGWKHPFSAQELPAFYTVSYLDAFVWYNGDNPWTGDTLSTKDQLPFWGGENAAQCTFKLREKNTETWCAWINGSDDYGLGVYVPNIDQLKAGRYEYDGSKSDVANSTGYVAPLNILKMVSFCPIEYSYLLTAGSTEEIRGVFTAHKDFTDNAALHENYQSTRLPSLSSDIAKLDFTNGQNLAMMTNPVSTTVEYDENAKAVKLTAGAAGDVSITIPYSAAITPLSSADYTTLLIEYRIPTDNAFSNYQSDIFICAGDVLSPNGDARLRVNLIADGEYHVLEVKLSGNRYWSGDIHSIRFDYFDASQEGDVMYVRNISLAK